MADTPDIEPASSEAPAIDPVDLHSGSDKDFDDGLPVDASPTAVSSTADYDYDDPGFEAGENILTPEDKPEPKAEAKPEPKQDEKPAEPVAEAPAQTFTPDQLMRAARLGFTPEEVAEFKSAKALDIAVSKAERLANPPQAPKQRPKPPEITPEQIAFKPKPFAFDRQKLISEGYDEKLVDYMEQTARHSHEQAQALANDNAQKLAALYKHNVSQHEWLQDFYEKVNQAEAARQQAQADHDAKQWNDDFKRIVDADTEHWKGVIDSSPTGRSDIQKHIGVLAHGYAAAGLPLPSNSELYEQAKHAVLGKNLQSVAREQVREQVTERNSRATNRPRPTPQPSHQSGDQAAIAHLQRTLYRRNGALS